MFQFLFSAVMSAKHLDNTRSMVNQLTCVESKSDPKKASRYCDQGQPTISRQGPRRLKLLPVCMLLLAGAISGCNRDETPVDPAKGQVSRGAHATAPTSSGPTPAIEVPVFGVRAIARPTWEMPTTLPPDPFTGKSETVDFGGDKRTMGYQITSKSQKPVTISKALYNGEFPALLAAYQRYETLTYYGPARDVKTPPKVPAAKGSYPVTLTIGESLDLYHVYSSGKAIPGDYLKQVIFIELHTDKGVVRVDLP